MKKIITGCLVLSLMSMSNTTLAKGIDNDQIGLMNVSSQPIVKKTNYQNNKIKEVSISSAEITDVEGHWAENNILKAVEDGYVAGYQDGTFRPDSEITRAEFAALVSRVSKLKTNQSPVGFIDSGHWASGSVYRLVNSGIIDESDYGNEFGFNEILTRWEMTKWLVNGLIQSNPSFRFAYHDTQHTILPFAEFYNEGFNEEEVPYLAIAKGTGLISGFPDGSAGLDRTTTRAEVVTILYRYLEQEGSFASNYIVLNELREVGLTGTNFDSIGVLGYDTQTTELKEVIGKKIVSRENLITATIHNYIFVKYENGIATGIYDPMFVDLQKETNSNYTGIVAYVDLSYEVSRDISSSLTLSNYLPYIYGGWLGTKPDNFNLSTVTSEDYLKAGKVHRVWTNFSISDFSNEIITEDGTRVAFGPEN
ncbi:S-layer homology domain-containing protein [Chengkuizengella sediminis]|uniref:S-layer homology domain-containing protein n=1 Tax=Chengkuizengella sediminis TaxID=1885917 RepID=UPI00138A18DB|nr:S-layer homology domain-containing protein [Chengkuizengella sediminis]NDI35483.1 S-layer homology domain-containing protein [Chengkuizengella sediminis]